MGYLISELVGLEGCLEWEVWLDLDRMLQSSELIALLRSQTRQLKPVVKWRSPVVDSIPELRVLGEPVFWVAEPFVAGSTDTGTELPLISNGLPSMFNAAGWKSNGFATAPVNSLWRSQKLKAAHSAGTNCFSDGPQLEVT